MKGKLAVDIYENKTHLVIIAPIAGVQIEDLDLKIEENSITIEGHREHIKNKVPKEDYLTEECFWGNFSRTIILPPNLDTDKINASFKTGILKIEIPKL